MAEVLDASSSDEVKLWLQKVHAALEKQPARELFAKFNRDSTVPARQQCAKHACKGRIPLRNADDLCLLSLVMLAPR